MSDDIRALLERAGPASVMELDFPRALQKGRRRAHRRTAVTALSTLAVAGVVATAVADWPQGQRVAIEPAPFTSGPAACASVAVGDPTDARHVDPANAPPAEALYDVPLPSAGPHVNSLSPVPTSMPDSSLDVRAVVHNLEHGAVAVWVDLEQVDGESVEAIELWARGLHADGFSSPAGGGIVISPAPAGLDVAPVSLRAWGVALDCSAWSADVADAFVREHFGTRGTAPERILTPYPDPDPLAR